MKCQALISGNKKQKKNDMEHEKMILVSYVAYDVSN